MEYIKFRDHTKVDSDQITREQALELDVHIGELCGELIKEDDQSVTVALIRWESCKDVKHEFVYVLLKANIITRHEVGKI